MEPLLCLSLQCAWLLLQWENRENPACLLVPPASRRKAESSNKLEKYLTSNSVILSDIQLFDSFFSKVIDSSTKFIKDQS